MSELKEESLQMKALRTNSFPLEVVDLSDKFEPMLSEEAQVAFRTKSQSTVFEFHRSSNGTTYKLEDVFGKVNELLKEEFRMSEGSAFMLGNRIQELIFKIDPGVIREAALCRYGQITASGKLKDVDKLKDEDMLKELADIYNRLIADKLIYPCIFCSPSKLEMSLYDPINNCHVQKQADGRYIGYGTKSVRTLDNADRVWDDKVAYPDNGEKLRLTMEGLREYTEEEAQELTAGYTYMLWVFPFRPEPAIGVDSYDRLNALLGKEFFVEEGSASKWIINF